MLTLLHRSLHPLLTQTGEEPWSGAQCQCKERRVLPWHPAGPHCLCRFVLLVSGLGLGGGGGESLLGTQLLVDVVTGQLGDEGEQCSAAHVSRVILAGNLLSHSTQSRDSINKVWRLPGCTQPSYCSRWVPAPGLCSQVAMLPKGVGPEGVCRVYGATSDLSAGGLCSAFLT